MDAASIVAIVIGVFLLVGWCSYEMWKNRRHNVYVRELQARDDERKVARAAEERIRKVAFYRKINGDEAANKMFPEEGTTKGQATTAEEKSREKEFYRCLYGDEKANKMFPEEGTTKGQATQQHAGEHGVQMQFISSEMPKNVTPQYVTVVTQPHY